MGQFPGFLSALGQAFGGYGQDQQNQIARQRQAGLDAQAAQRLTMDQSLANAQIGNYKSEAEQRTSAIEAARIKALSNQRAHAALSKLDPSVGEYDDGTDYTTALKSTQEGAAKQRLEIAKQRRDYNTLKAEFKTHPLASQPFSEQDPADYTAALGDARDLRKVNAAAGKQHWVSTNATDAATGAPILMNSETGETRVGVGVAKLAGGESPQVAATRKDLKGLQSQQIRAEHDVGASKSDIRSLLHDHPRASQPLSVQRTATDSTFANQYGNASAQLGEAEQRKARLTHSADSTQSVLNGFRTAQPAPGATPPLTGAPPGPDVAARAKLENDGYVEAVNQIKSTVKDPAQRTAALQQAMQIYNARLQKVNAGQDPDAQ